MIPTILAAMEVWGCSNRFQRKIWRGWASGLKGSSTISSWGASSHSMASFMSTYFFIQQEERLVREMPQYWRSDTNARGQLSELICRLPATKYFIEQNKSVCEHELCSPKKYFRKVICAQLQYVECECYSRHLRINSLWQRKYLKQIETLEFFRCSATKQKMFSPWQSAEIPWTWI